MLGPGLGILLQTVASLPAVPRVPMQAAPPIGAADAALAVAAGVGGVNQPWRTFIVAGGPSPDMNQVAIEGNVRYLDRILDKRAGRRVLFADGQRDTETVAFLTPGGRRVKYRATQVPRLDGASTAAGFASVWSSFVAPRAADPLLLYFTGHGVRNPRGDLDDNIYETWGGGGITVRQLARRIESLPVETPVVLVMAQCFSGSFANVVFDEGRPDNEATPRDIAGFFAATADRPATGCTPEINEADYRDFTSYFFAALTGTSRTGQRITGADYDGNGWVGMDEAFAWALVEQETEDVPVSTSDAFLRKYVDKPDEETMDVRYSAILSWSTPAQRAALEGMSLKLGLTGEQRLRTAYDAQFGARRNRAESENLRAHRLRFIRAAKSVVLARSLVDSNDRRLVARWQRLRALESMNPVRGLGTLPARPAVLPAPAVLPEAALPPPSAVLPEAALPEQPPARAAAPAEVLPAPRRASPTVPRPQLPARPRGR